MTSRRRQLDPGLPSLIGSLDLDFVLWDLGFRVHGLEFMVQGLKLGVWGMGFRV
jgi:hypothetical protein